MRTGVQVGREKTLVLLTVFLRGEAFFMDVRALQKEFRHWPVRATTVPERASEGTCLSVIGRYTELLRDGRASKRYVEVLVKTELEIIVNTLSENPERWLEVPIYERYLELLQEV